MGAQAQPQAQPQPSKATTVNAASVEAATGAKAEVADGVVKAMFPRSDVPVTVDGWRMPPFMGLTSWVGFVPGRRSEAMIMGDLVVFQDEVNPVIDVLFANGVEVTALHNHFFYDRPPAFFMHVSGEGTVAALGRGVKLAIEKTKELRKRSPQPARTSGAPALPD